MAFAFACRPCAASDPVTDTVKVSFPSPIEGKENLAPLRDDKAEQMAKEQAARERADADAKAARQAAEAEAKRQAAEAEERRRREAEAATHAEAAARAEAEAAVAEAEEAERQEEQQRLVAQQAAEEAARQEAAEKAEIEKRVNEFLASHGFKGGVNSKKSSMLKYQYPLHAAVKEQDAEMVKSLLSTGADASLKNSSGKTPAQKAEQYNKQKKGDVVSTNVLRALGC